MSAVYTPLFDKIQRHTHRYSTNVSGIHPAIFDKVDVHSYVHTTRACVHIFATRISPTNLRFSFGSCRFRCIIFVLLLTCLAAFALTLLVCLFACRRKRNDRTRRGPMQRGATLPLPSRWPSTKGCSNTCGQPHCATSMWLKKTLSMALPTAMPETRLAFGKDILLAPDLHKGHHSPKHNTICCCRCC